MYESQRYDSNIVYKLFQLVTEIDKKLVDSQSFQLLLTVLALRTHISILASFMTKCIKTYQYQNLERGKRFQPFSRIPWP
jgi:hypothetical protein